MKIEILVKAKSHEQKIEQIAKDLFCVHVKSLPEKGKANKEIVSLIADYFKIPQSSVHISKGRTHKRKVIELLDA